MSAGLYNTDREVVEALMAGGPNMAMPPELALGLNRVLRATTSFKLGVHNDNVVYIFGIIAPSIMSDFGYLWMHVVDKAPRGSVVTLMRHSRETIAGLLEIYPMIVGHATEQSQRWLRWLGATFGEPLADGLIPFTFRRQNG